MPVDHKRMERRCPRLLTAAGMPSFVFQIIRHLLVPGGVFATRDPWRTCRVAGRDRASAAGVIETKFETAALAVLPNN
jgi:hypothetical protein